MSNNYIDTVLHHFLDPLNVGVIVDPDGTGMVGDMACGDTMVMTIRVQDDHLTDIKYQVFGYAAAIATCSAISEMAMGKALDEVLTITEDDIIRYLGELPDPKRHCSAGAAAALHYAILDYRKTHTPGRV